MMRKLQNILVEVMTRNGTTATPEVNVPVQVMQSYLFPKLRLQ